MRGQSEIVPREGAKTPRARDGRGGAARDDARAMGEGNRDGGWGKTNLMRACVNITDVGARERTVLRSRAALGSRAPPRLGVAAAKTGFPLLGKLFIQRERGPGVVHGGVLAALNV